MTTTIGTLLIRKELIVELLQKIDAEIMAEPPSPARIIRITDEETGLQIVYSHIWCSDAHVLKSQIEITWEDSLS